MPNWTENQLIIKGDPALIHELATQVSQPYESEYENFRTGEVESSTNEGCFLLWNIVKPTNLDIYYQREERLIRQAERIISASHPNPPKPVSPEEMVAAIKEGLENTGPIDFAKLADQFEQEVAEKDDWYHWNIRNWGTKWEISEATTMGDGEGTIEYGFQTAWSPPVEAILNLSSQYPTLAFQLDAIDEGGGFCCEISIQNGSIIAEKDIEITHEVNEKFYGECFCSMFDDYEPDDLHQSCIDARFSEIVEANNG